MPFISPKDEPFMVTPRAALAVGDEGHAALQRRRCIRGEQVGRQPDRIDMAIGGDHVVFHFLSSRQTRH
jgi:hypothetical protein